MSLFKKFTADQLRELGLPNTAIELEVKSDDGDVRSYHMIFTFEAKTYCVEFDAVAGDAVFFKDDFYNCLEVKKTLMAAYSWVLVDENPYYRHSILKDGIASLNKEKLEVESQLYVKHMDGIKAKGMGSYSRLDGDFKFTCTSKETVKIDQEIASKNPELFRTKYELDKKKFDLLPNEQKILVERAMTTTPAKPSFKIEHIAPKAE